MSEILRPDIPNIDNRREEHDESNEQHKEETQACFKDATKDEDDANEPPKSQNWSVDHLV